MLNELTAGGETRWDSFVRSVPGGTFFHLSGWKGVLENVFGHRTFYLQAECQGRIIGVLPLTYMRSRYFGDALVSNAFCVYGGPIAEDEHGIALLQNAAERLMDKWSVPRLEFR